MYIERVPNRNSPPAILLRESYRQDGKVRKRTLANLSKWPPELIEQFQQLLKGVPTIDKLEDAFEIVRSQPHGHGASRPGDLASAQAAHSYPSTRQPPSGFSPGDGGCAHFGTHFKAGNGPRAGSPNWFEYIGPGVALREGHRSGALQGHGLVAQASKQN